MAAAIKRRRIAVGCLAICLEISGNGCNGVQMNEHSGDREKAAALVRTYGRHIGAAVIELDAENDRSFGETGLHYDAARRVLTGRAFIMKLDSDLMKPELNGPVIVPLFERAAGYFEFDAAKDILFLKKDFPLATITERQLRDQMDELSAVSVKWVLRWYGWAMQIVYGTARPPGAPLPVSRANDAQHTEFRR